MNLEYLRFRPRQRLEGILRQSMMVAIITLWLSLIVGGLSVWGSYEMRPGPTGDLSTVGPRSGEVQGWDLQLFLHPHCTCSKASLYELARIQEQTTSRPRIRIWFVRPQGVPDGWEQGFLWDLAIRFFGDVVESDPAGKQARKWRVFTSGTLIVHNPHGQVVFYGGITRGRGLLGDNDGERIVRDLLTREKSAPKTCPVYGCPLLDPDESLDFPGGTR